MEQRKKQGSDNDDIKEENLWRQNPAKTPTASLEYNSALTF